MPDKLWTMEVPCIYIYIYSTVDFKLGLGERILLVTPPHLQALTSQRPKYNKNQIYQNYNCTCDWTGKRCPKKGKIHWCLFDNYCCWCSHVSTAGSGQGPSSCWRRGELFSYHFNNVSFKYFNSNYYHQTCKLYGNYNQKQLMWSL